MDRPREAPKPVRAAGRIGVGLALVLLPLAACGPGGENVPESGEASANASSVLLVTLDTTRRDALTSFGGRPGITPHLDALAADGLAFDRAYTVAPLTLPAHTSILTGLIPPRHGLRVNGAARLGAEAQTMAEIAHAAGLKTAAFLSAVVLDRAFGLDQGFEVYDAPKHTLVQTSSHFNDRTGIEVVDAAAAWLKTLKPGARFFLWVHLWDAHGPWDPPAQLRALAPDDEYGYLGDVALEDRAFGRLMDALKESGHGDQTLVAVVADHGEAFFEHGEFSHGALIFEPTMHVPMILRFPNGYRRGERSDAVVSVVDLLPTMAQALALDVPPGLDGHSLLADGPQASAQPRGAYLESYYGYLAYGWAPIVGFVNANGKFIDGGHPRLFDPVRDPDEARDLSQIPGQDLASYEEAIRTLAQRPTLATESAGASESVRAGISALGYAEIAHATDLPRPLTAIDRPDPIEQISEHTAMLDAMGAFNDGNYPEAERRCRAVLARNAGNIDALERLGITLIRQQRFEEAVRPLLRAFRSSGGTAAGAVNLGTCYRKLGQLDLATDAFEHALAIDGSQVRAVRHLVDLMLMAGKKDRARTYARQFERLTGESLPIQ